MPLKTLVYEQERQNQLVILPINLDHVLALDNLPLHHKDPFDRLLIAQAMVEQAAIISTDPKMSEYPVQVIW